MPGKAWFNMWATFASHSMLPMSHYTKKYLVRRGVNLGCIPFPVSVDDDVIQLRAFLVTS